MCSKSFEIQHLRDQKADGYRTFPDREHYT